ncbi:beta-Ig-H3 fasciclin [Chlorella sorokiniana]|jgi:uncharacterized surface protein with fasciclin (FAS1) repeats|uniref:Beta-Ig-H3 fasciclin n=1 Tax=Chlorella sorokiniana TaxID=3076 RepID=A0A2P6TWP4_CHLSO|nr:beta-Ig-H3 fasciclin [Chlorella sorokiniana]|eukprot:PRW58483.1 beta-Ig-H3 fasciclin [Chlorella sorokiniana]
MRQAVLLCALALLAGQAAAHCNYRLGIGETLSEIAKAYEIDLEDVIAANPQLGDPNVVMAGSIIRLPCKPQKRGNNLLDLLEHRNETAELVQAIYTAGMSDALEEIDSDATLFAPIDSAFDALLDKLNVNLTDLAANPKQLMDILQYHLVLGDSLRAQDIKEGETQVETALGKDITVVKKGKDVSIKLPNGDEAKVVTADLRGGQAVVHLIDLVLTPPAEEEQKPAEPAAAPAGAPGSGPCTYTIASGDTLAAIGIKFGTTVDAILKLNPSISDPNKIVAGSSINVRQC